MTAKKRSLPVLCVLFSSICRIAHRAMSISSLVVKRPQCAVVTVLQHQRRILCWRYVRLILKIDTVGSEHDWPEDRPFMAVERFERQAHDCRDR